MTVRPSVILITDLDYGIEHICSVVEAAASALPAGKLMVQLRDKKTPHPFFRMHAQKLREVTSRVGALLCLNAIRPMAGLVLDLFEEIEADGLHVACTMPGIVAARDLAKWVSTPVHDDKDANVAWRTHADAMLVSPIFMTPGKGKPRGLGAIIQAASLNRGAIYALGGVSAHHAPMCAQSGAHGVAVIRSLLAADDPAAVARALAAPFAEV